MKKLSILFLSLVILSACGGPRDEKTAYIDATIEATCYLFSVETPFAAESTEKIGEIYSKFGFDATNSAEMESLKSKYENDPEVAAALLKGLDECGGGIQNLDQIEAGIPTETSEELEVATVTSPDLSTTNEVSSVTE